MGFECQPNIESLEKALQGRRQKMTRYGSDSDVDDADGAMRRSLSESSMSPMCRACGHEHAPGTTCETCGHHRRPASRDPGVGGGESTSNNSVNGRSRPTRCEPIVEVIDKFLCIGAFEHTSRDEALLACGIRTVMNVRWRSRDRARALMSAR